MIGAITIVRKSGQDGSPAFKDVLAFNGDAAYPTGGTPLFQELVRARFGDRREVIAVFPQDCGGYTCAYDKTNDKLKVYYGDFNNASDGPMIEVPNTTNLSAVVFHVVVDSE